MKQFTKYICAFLMLVGINASVWGAVIDKTNYTISTDAVNFGNLDASTPAYVAAGVIETYQEVTITLKTNVNTYAYFIASPDDYYITGYNDASQFYVGSTVGSYTIRVYTYFGLENETHSRTLYIYMGAESEELSVTGTVINACTPNNVVYDHSGTGGNDPTGDDTACEDATVTFTPDPSTGYAYSGATVFLSDMETVHASLNASTTSFTMPDEDVYVVATYAPINYTISFNANGGSGSMDDVVKAYNSSYSLPSCTMTAPTGYEFKCWAQGSAGGTERAVGYSHTVTEDITFYAKWQKKDYELTVASTDNVTITATPASGSALAEGADPIDVQYEKTVTLNYSTITDGKNWAGWKVYKTEDASTTVSVSGTGDGATFTMPAYNVTVSANLFGDFVFSCAELTLTAHPETESAPIFITSAAGKKVRSQGYITITGSGLTPNTALTFPGLDSKFDVLTSTGGTISTDASGAIDDVNAYIFYTPAADAESDGLDQMAGLTVSVGGAKPKQVSLVHNIIGRHLPADFVIAGKKDGKWYALPANFSEESTPTPVEIAVDNINDPSIAYTANTNIYNLYGQNSGASGFLYNDGDSDGNPDGEKIKLGMKNNGSKPLFAFAPDKNSLKGDGTATVTNNIGKQYWWTLKQTNTNITNPQDAKYTMISSNNPGTLSIKNIPFVWGTYKSGVEELRLIPASDIVFTEAYFVEWGQHGGVIEVDAQGVDATSVVAHLGEATSSAIALVQTKASDAKNKSSKYNYTVNFGDGIDFAAAASNGALLTLEWKNGETVKAVSNIVVPKIIASNITINKTNYPLKSDWNTEVHVLPGKTVTVEADYSPNPDVTIKELNIYPGATVVASTGTLIATNLVLRNGWSRAGSKTYDVARLHVTASAATLKATNVYADWYIDYDQYYPIAVPWNATVANFSYRYSSVSPTVGPEENIRLRYYDGASRASNVQTGVGEGVNWKQYGEGSNLAVPSSLVPSKAYAMTAKRPTGKAFSIIRMPLTLPSGTWGEATWTTNGESGTIGEPPADEHKDTVYVKAHGNGTTPAYAKGWNFIANPYMSLHKGALNYTDEGTIEYANIPDVDFREYDQVPIAATKLKPASGFLVQAPKDGTVTFGEVNRAASAPSYRREAVQETMPTQRAYITLANDEAEDMMGILVGENYTAEYESNADLTKLLSDGNTLRTYMYYGEQNMAYLAISPVLAQEWIPIRVRIPAEGEYTFSLDNASVVEHLEGIYLIDYANGDQVTNLIEESYTFTATAGTINGRFAINAIVGERQTPTAIDAIGGGEKGNGPIKFIYHDNVYIWHNGVIYDATGKKVQ